MSVRPRVTNPRATPARPTAISGVVLVGIEKPKKASPTETLKWPSQVPLAASGITELQLESQIIF